MAYDPRVLQAIRENAEASGDPIAYIATAMTESNLDPDAIGDGGHSGGLFQENDRGRGAGIPMPKRLDPFGNAQRGAKEFRTFYDRGYRGAKLALAAQRPSDPAYTSKFQRNLPKAQQLWSQLSGAGAPKPKLPAQPSAPVTPEPPDLLSLAKTALPARQGDESLTRTMGRAFLTQRAMQLDKPKQAGVEAIKAVAAPAKPTTPDTVVANAAKRHLGVPYSWGGGSVKGPSEGFGRGKGIVGFDCSSLVQYAWAKAGVKIPRTTYEQLKALPAVSTDPKTWKVGDLVFPNEGHVYMYLGNGQGIQAPRTGGKVEIIDARPGKYVRRPQR